MTDTNGVRLQLVEYDPWGKVTRSEGDADPSRRFTGKELDPETGLYYYGGRYYDPVLGRFISPDPFVQSIAYPQALNRYAYVLNDPVNHIDPSGYFFKSLGKFFKKIVGAIVGVVVGAAVTVASGGNVALGAAVGFVVGSTVQGAVDGGAKGAAAGFVSSTAIVVGALLGGIPGAVAGGAAGGAAAAAIPGPNVSKGAGLGALSGAIYGVTSFAASQGIGFDFGTSSAAVTASQAATSFAYGFVGGTLVGIATGQSLGAAAEGGAISGAVAGGVSLGLRAWDAMPSASGSVYASERARLVATAKSDEIPDLLFVADQESGGATNRNVIPRPETVGPPPSPYDRCHSGPCAIWVTPPGGPSYLCVLPGCDFVYPEPQKPPRQNPQGAGPPRAQL